jgi:capsule polysaccharide export protein KpsE/RkpR
MGFAASQARLLMLTARKTDIELQSQFINQARMQMGNTVGSLMNLTADLNPESPTMQALQARIAAIQQIDKALELQQTRLGSQYKMIEAEFDSLKKIVEKSIQGSFKLLS